MKRSVIFFPQKETAAFAEEEFNASLTDDQVLVKLDYDLISAGTELANYHALPNTGTDGNRFPHYPGYSASGHVLQIGPNVKKLKIGERVVAFGVQHRSHVIGSEKKFYPVLDGVTQQEAAFSYLQSFSMLGVRKLELQLGESVMIAGMGLLGQFAVQYARHSGACPILACDFSQERRQLALDLGADYALDPRDADFIAKVKDLTGGGPNGAVEATGFISALQQALEYIAFEGRISLLGCTRISDQPIDFYRYVHLRGVRLIGCHTLTRPSVDSRPGEWTTFDDFRTFFRLIRHRELKVGNLISKTVSPRDAESVYRELGFSKNPPTGVLIDWTSIPE